MKSKIAEDIEYQWITGEVCFDCPCGEKEIILSDNGDIYKCDCGREYELIHYVMVKEG